MQASKAGMDATISLFLSDLRFGKPCCVTGVLGFVSLASRSRQHTAEV